MIDVQTLVTVFMALGGGLGIAGVFYIVPNMRKLMAEARKVTVEARVVTSQADDAHFEKIIKLQTEAIVAPLEARVRFQDERMRTQDDRITALEKELTDVRVKYRAALRLIRALFQWIATNGRQPETAPHVPELIADDV